MTIDLICSRCGYPQAAHNLSAVCGDGQRSTGFMLMDSHALDDVPPVLRALERARLAQEQYERRTNVQLRLSNGGAS